MSDRRARLPAGTRSASQRAAQKVFENELAVAELRGADRVRRHVREAITEAAETVRVDRVDIDVVPVVVVERALAADQANDQRTRT